MSASTLRKLQQARERLQNGETIAAAALCEEALARAPRNPEALWLLGTIRLMTGAPDEAAALLERAVAWCLDQGLLRRHAERVSTRLAAARSRVVRLAQEAGCRLAAEPQGLFGWVDAGVDTEPLAVRMASEGWLIAPGRLFHVPSRSSTLMRVNFASAQDARFWRAFERARDALR